MGGEKFSGEYRKGTSDNPQIRADKFKDLENLAGVDEEKGVEEVVESEGNEKDGRDLGIKEYIAGGSDLQTEQAWKAAPAVRGKTVSSEQYLSNFDSLPKIKSIAVSGGDSVTGGKKKAPEFVVKRRPVDKGNKRKTTLGESIRKGIGEFFGKN